MPNRKVIHLTVMVVLLLSRLTTQVYADSTLSKLAQLRFHDFEPRQINTLGIFGENSIESTKRSPRGFHFHADKEDIEIELEFVVPLLHVPLGVSRSLSSGVFRNLVNLNTAALIQTGAFVLVGALVALLVKLLSTPFTLPDAYGYKKAARQAESGIKYKDDNYFVTFVEKKLLENNIDMPVCLQRSICDFVKKSNVAVTKGKPTSLDTMVEALTSMHTLRDSIKGSAVQEAIDWGLRNSTSCSNVYGSCELQQIDGKALQLLMNYGKYFIRGF